MTYEEKVTLLRLFADRVENECYVAFEGTTPILIEDLVEKVYTTMLEEMYQLNNKDEEIS